MSDASARQVIVAIDDTDPRDPTARCDRCGVQGTVARATQHSEPPVVTRYCSPCWPEAQAEFEAQRQRYIDLWRRWHSERQDDSTPPLPPSRPSFSSASRCWHDVRRYLARVLPADASPSTRPDLARTARTYRERAPEMDGPMPPDIVAFVEAFDPPAGF